MSDESVLEGFGPATRAWFETNFVAPTPAQVGAWTAASRGEHTLVVAPTGSGKTLASFLWAIDRLLTEPEPAPERRCRVLYVSPLKALAVDVERNLRSPLIGIRHAADRLGIEVREPTVAVRSGDTPASERARFAKHPADILITTPESLFLLLTSNAREALRGIDTVIIDEIHAVAGSKRGAHMAVTLERLDALLERPATRIGLSATVRPVEEVARFLAGGRPVTIVQPPATKTWELTVEVPVPDMAALPPPPDGTPPDVNGQSLWPHVEERIVDLIAEHRSTLVFANSRRLAERLTARLNEIWDARLHPAEPDPETGEVPLDLGAANRPPAMVMASGRSEGAPPILARAHHGSVSREQRAEIEGALKAGTLPAVVATSSLELGIDMGAIDLVIQVEAPPSVASGLQRVGRAGHQVGAVSTGIVFPKFRGDLLTSSVVVERMREGAIERLKVQANPIDVLAQQVVAITAMEDVTVADLGALLRRSAPFAALPDSILSATLDMLSGRYPSDEFAELKPRIVWDRATDVLQARPGAQRLAILSGGTIPDRGLFGVFLAGAEGPGRRVGELDEEMVYESRVGDVFALGSSSWRIEEITHDRVMVSPAPGMPARLPFWKGDQQGRPYELGQAVGGFLRTLGGKVGKARERLTAMGLTQWSQDNLLAYVGEQRAAISDLPTDKTVVIERFRDEIGDWRVVIHSVFGGRVNGPWALAIAARLRERYGFDVSATSSDDGIVLRFPDAGEGDEPAWAAELGEIVAVDPDEISELVTAELGGSAVFASRFRECAGRALLLPRRDPRRRQALWQQRQRSAQLLEVASNYPTFPIVLEAVREVLTDVYDVEALTEVLTQVRSREVRLVEARTAQPSPFARGVAFGYVAHYLYEGDAPLAERRAAALSLDPGLLAELLGRGEGASLRDLLDVEAVEQLQAELQRLTPERAARDGEDLYDVLRVLGPLSVAELARRAIEGIDVDGALRGLGARVVELGIAGERRWAVAEDVARLRDALGTAVPAGVAYQLLEPSVEPLESLLIRYARTHVPFTAAQVASEWALGVAVVQAAIGRLVARGQLVEGELLPSELAPGGREVSDPDILRRLRRRSLATLRAEVEAVPPVELARFGPRWHGLLSREKGAAALLTAVDQLAGLPVPASALESLILPARIDGYTPAMLDEALTRGDLLWQGHGEIGRDDGWVSLHHAESAPLTLHPPEGDPTDEQAALLESLAGGGSFLPGTWAQALGRAPDAGFADDVWSLVWAGRVTSETFAPVRALLKGGRAAHRTPRATTTRPASAMGLRASRWGSVARRRGPGPNAPDVLAGRWHSLPALEPDDTVRAWALAEQLIARHGVLTRGAVTVEEPTGGFAAVYRVLAAAEDAGAVRRGYFVEGLGASQFASVGAVDRLRAQAAKPYDTTPPSPLAHAGAPVKQDEAVVLAATDPANAYGAALAWPAHEGHRPGRKAGALVALVGGELVAYVERGGRTVLTFTEDARLLADAAAALAEAVHSKRIGGLTIEKIDGDDALADSPLGPALQAAGFSPVPKGWRLRG